VIDVIVDQRHAGQRLDRVVQDLVPDLSRAAAQGIVDAGGARVDGEPRSRSFRVRRGMRLEVDAVEVVSSATPTPERTTPEPTIVFDDPLFAVVDKPAGLVTHAAPGVRGRDLATMLAERGLAGGGEAGRPGIVHRLDRDTSGLLVVAKDDATRRALQGLLRRRAIEREYLALVHGRPASTTGRIEAPIGRDPRARTRQAIDGIGARPAVTHFETVEAFPEHTLLGVRLDTGRTHQIRVHLAAIDLPVVGDPVYGNPSADPLGMERQALHARRLAFPHPRDGEQLSFVAPPPADLERALGRLRAA
jgi:23S rRNA pseudouridine1911/1915/1917 synthase